MYGLVGKFYAVPGQRDALVAILLEGVEKMPGCLSYVVATDPADTDAIWITEVWDSEASHKASLSLPSVKAAISKGKPLIARFGESHVTAPVGGHGLVTGAVRLGRDPSRCGAGNRPTAVWV
jgi:quinol monooxygenase YgiN